MNPFNARFWADNAIRPEPFNANNDWANTAAINDLRGELTGLKTSVEHMRRQHLVNSDATQTVHREILRHLTLRNDVDEKIQTLFDHHRSLNRRLDAVERLVADLYGLRNGNQTPQTPISSCPLPSSDRPPLSALPH